MNKNQQKFKQFQRLFLHDKQEAILELCIQKCTQKSKPGSSFSGRQVTCMENCEIKLLNSYAFLFDVVKNGGVFRSSESVLKTLAI